MRTCVYPPSQGQKYMSTKGGKPLNYMYVIRFDWLLFNVSFMMSRVYQALIFIIAAHM